MAKKNIEVDAAAADVQKAANVLHDAEEAHKKGGKREPVIAALVSLRDANRRHVAAIEASAPPTAGPPAVTPPATLPAE
jgi:hypothetical protein